MSDPHTIEEQIQAIRDEAELKIQKIKEREAYVQAIPQGISKYGEFFVLLHTLWGTKASYQIEHPRFNKQHHPMDKTGAEALMVFFPPEPVSRVRWKDGSFSVMVADEYLDSEESKEFQDRYPIGSFVLDFETKGTDEYFATIQWVSRVNGNLVRMSVITTPFLLNQAVCGMLHLKTTCVHGVTFFDDCSLSYVPGTHITSYGATRQKGPKHLVRTWDRDDAPSIVQMFKA